MKQLSTIAKDIKNSKYVQDNIITPIKTEVDKVGHMGILEEGKVYLKKLVTFLLKYKVVIIICAVTYFVFTYLFEEKKHDL
jgi:hypothetical protein